MSLKTLHDTPPWQWPEDAADIIQTALTDGLIGESDRKLAIDLAGDPVVINDDLADILMAIIKDGREDEETRCLAAVSLGPGLEKAFMEDDEGFLWDYGYGEESGISRQVLDSVQESLCRLYRDAAVPEMVRRRILESSVREPRDWHRAAVNGAFSSSDDDWRLTAVFCMGLMPGFEDQIRESLEDDNPDVFQEAVNSAINQGIDEVLPHVRQVLSANRPEDQSLVFDIIGLVPEVWPEIAYDLLEPLIHDMNKEVAEAALDALTLSQTILELDDEFDDEFEEDED